MLQNTSFDAWVLPFHLFFKYFPLNIFFGTTWETTQSVLIQKMRSQETALQHSLEDSKYFFIAFNVFFSSEYFILLFFKKCCSLLRQLRLVGNSTGMFSLMADKEKKKKKGKTKKEGDITYSHHFIIHRMWLT